MADYKQNGRALENTSRQNHKSALAAVKQYGRVLKFVDVQTSETRLAALENILATLQNTLVVGKYIRRTQ